MKNIFKNSMLAIFILSSLLVITTSVQAASPTLVSANAFSERNSVTLEGAVNPNGYLTTAWFEYGTSKTLSEFDETIHAVIGDTKSITPIRANIINLLPDTDYYFRIVADNGQITLKGSIINFTTKATTLKENSSEETKNNTPISHDTSDLLKIVTLQEDLSAGDEIDYFISFDNKTDENFKNVKIRVELPREVEFVMSDFGKEENTNVITFYPGIVFASETGSFKIKAKLNSKIIDKNILITTAVMTYDSNSLGVDNKEIATVVNDITPKIQLGANIVKSEKSFLPSTLIEWLVLLLIIMCLVVVSRMMYKDTSTEVLKKNL